MLSNKRGFSLPELMVIIGIIAIVGAIAVPMSISSISARRLSTSSLEMLALLEHARSSAIKRGEPVFVSIDPAQSSYRANVGSPTGDTVRTGKLPAGITLQQPASDALPAAFRFNSHGLPEAESSPGAWVLTRGKLQLSDGGRHANKTVSLNAGGNAKIERTN
jgi:prepilin-type N-terminal cleavage/methylation domain-containing protein